MVKYCEMGLLEHRRQIRPNEGKEVSIQTSVLVQFVESLFIKNMIRYVYGFF